MIEALFNVSVFHNYFTQSFELDGFIQVQGVDSKLHSMGISVGQLPVAQPQLERKNWRVQEQQEQEWDAIGLNIFHEFPWDF